MAESVKHENFIRLASARTETLLDQCRKLSNLASSNYECTDTEVAKMFGAIEKAVADAKAKFTGPKTRQKFTF